MRLRKGASKNPIQTEEEFKNLPQTQSRNGSVRCIVVNETTFQFDYHDLAHSLIPTDSIPILDGDLTHLLSFNGEKFVKIDYTPTDNDDKTPQDCFEAGCWDELERLFTLESKILEKIKLGVFIALAICLLIVFFLVSTMAMGGGSI